MSDRAQRTRTAEQVFQAKIKFTLVLVVAGLIITAVCVMNTTEATQDHATGIIIDFDDYKVTWYETDIETESDPVKLLEDACDENGFPLVTDSKGNVLEINGYLNNEERSWNLWYIERGTTTWVKSESYNIKAKDYSITAWAFRGDGETPTIAVDSTGVCVYGYQQAHRIVSLSPVTTETVASVGAANIIVGADYYSNYPDEINVGKSRGEIANTGTYTDPNYEIVMNLMPDMIVGDGSQYNQVQLCKTARANTNAVILYSGNDIKTIFDNTYIAGIALGYDLAFDMYYGNATDALDDIDNVLDTVLHSEKRVMVSLSADVSPYVSGSDTYMDDILGMVYMSNAFSSLDGWSHINTEMIAQKDPEIIVIVTSEYAATQEEWDLMYSQLYDTWKATKAYQDGEIYLLTGDSTDLASRSSPRFPRMVELMAEICYPEAFGMDSMPKYIGNDYMDYITLSKYLGYI